MALARGMAGDAVGVGVVGVVAMVTVAAAGATDVGSSADVASPVDGALSADVASHVVRPPVSTAVVGSTAALWPMAVADSTVAAVASTVVVEGTAAGTGNRGLIARL